MGLVLVLWGASAEAEEHFNACRQLGQAAAVASDSNPCGVGGSTKFNSTLSSTANVAQVLQVLRVASRDRSAFAWADDRPAFMRALREKVTDRLWLQKRLIHEIANCKVNEISPGSCKREVDAWIEKVRSDWIPMRRELALRNTYLEGLRSGQVSSCQDVNPSAKHLFTGDVGRLSRLSARERCLAREEFVESYKDVETYHRHLQQDCPVSTEGRETVFRVLSSGVQAERQSSIAALPEITRIRRSQAEKHTDAYRRIVEGNPLIVFIDQLPVFEKPGANTANTNSCGGGGVEAVAPSFDQIQTAARRYERMLDEQIADLKDSDLISYEPQVAEVLWENKNYCGFAEGWYQEQVEIEKARGQRLEKLKTQAELGAGAIGGACLLVNAACVPAAILMGAGLGLTAAGLAAVDQFDKVTHAKELASAGFKRGLAGADLSQAIKAHVKKEQAVRDAATEAAIATGVNVLSIGSVGKTVYRAVKQIPRTTESVSAVASGSTKRTAFDRVWDLIYGPWLRKVARENRLTVKEEEFLRSYLRGGNSTGKLGERQEKVEQAVRSCSK